MVAETTECFFQIFMRLKKIYTKFPIRIYIYTCLGIGSEIKTPESLQLILHFNFNVPNKMKRLIRKYYLKGGYIAY